MKWLAISAIVVGALFGALITNHSGISAYIPYSLGIYNFSPPTLTNGEASPLQLDINGNLIVSAGSGIGTVTSVTCGTGLSGGTITTTGTCTLDLTHANSWSGVQTFGDGDLVLSGSGSGSSTIKAPATGGGTATLPAGSGTLVYSAGAGTVTSITCNAGLTGGTITTTGTCALDLSHANTWAAVQTFTNSDIALLGSSTGKTTFTSANSGASNFTLTFPAVTDTLAALGTAQTWTALQTITNSDLALLGSSTGKTTFTSDNASGTNYTVHLPAANDTLAELAATQAFTNKTITDSTNVVANAVVGAVNLQTGSSTGNVVTAPREYFYCTASCTVTPPSTPVVGSEFCIINKAGTTGVITVGGNTSIFYAKTDGSGYGSSGGTLTSGGAAGDMVCLVGYDSTHYETPNFRGVWTAS